MGFQMPRKLLPLDGQTVVVTRAEAQSAGLGRAFSGKGARVILAPAIKTIPPASWKSADAALDALERFDALVVTSANGAQAFLARAKTRRKSGSLLAAVRAGALKVYAVGPATAKALSRLGMRSACVPEKHEGKALAESLGTVRGKRVLIARALAGREDLPRLLRARGAAVTVAVCYRTVPDPAGADILRKALSRRWADWVTFTSGSTVKNFVAAAGGPAQARKLLRTARACSIGPVTSGVLRRYGIEPAAEAAPYTTGGLLDAVLRRSARVPDDELRETLLTALKEAGAVAARRLGKSVSRLKGKANLVTDADLACEERILRIILQRFPDHDFVTEESAPRADGSDYVWIIDPIDGTNNFAHGYPAFCVSIAVARRGKTLLGGVYDPSRDELFCAEAGRGAWLNGKRIRVSGTRSLSSSLLLTGFPYDRDRHGRFYLDIVGDFLSRCHGIRRSGSAALDLAWTAAGRVDGYWEFKLNPWDVAAGTLLVKEAGGKVTDFKGRPFSAPTTDGSTALATNGHIHGAMLSVLKTKK